MNTRQVLWITALSGVLFAAGCAPTAGGGYYGYPSSRTYDPYRSHKQEHRSLEREHQEQHEHLEQKYDKAMNRLDRQERQAQEKLNRKYRGNPSDPRYQEQLNKI